MSESASAARWRKANPEKARAAVRRSYHKHRGQRLEDAKAYRLANPDKILRNARVQNLRLYGLTPDDYQRMLVAQGGTCAVCNGTNPSGRRLAVDHDHGGGAVRGLLCLACNRGIGALSDDPARLRAAAEYLEAKK